jgi:hypothetical protein
VTLSSEQRTAAVTYLSEGATFSETWSMIGASRRDAESDYLQGKSESEHGVESELRDWYLEASASRARIRATLRAEARESAGSREATDKLQVLAALLAEEEPTAIAESGDVRASSPLLSLTDRIKVEEDPVERDRLKAVQQKAETALHDLFVEMTRRVSSRRR